MALLSLEKAARTLCEKTGQFVPTTIGLHVIKERLAFEQAQPIYLHPVKKMTETIWVSDEVGQVVVRVFLPVDLQEAEQVPPLLYLHGGQFITGDAKTYDKLCRELTARARVCLLFVEYSNLFEAKAPTQLLQAQAVFDSLASLALKYPLDLKRVLVAGDDVGGTLALNVALRAKASNLPIYKLLLFYPVTNTNFDTSSYVSFAGGYYLTREQMKWALEAYRGNLDLKDLLLAPLQASFEQLAKLPETLIMTAEADVTRDEAEALARKMRDAGVDVSQIRFQGIIHDFVSLHILDKTNACRLAMNIATDWLAYRR